MNHLFPTNSYSNFSFPGCPKTKNKNNFHVVNLEFCIHHETDRAGFTKEERIKELLPFFSFQHCTLIHSDKTCPLLLSLLNSQMTTRHALSAEFEEHLAFSGIWLAVTKGSNVLHCFALNIALTCNYHRIHWENKVPGWFMLHSFPKPELKPSKPPKLNHQTESPRFQMHGEQLRGAAHGSCGKHSPGGGNHPPLQQNHSGSREGGLVIELISFRPCLCSHLFVVNGSSPAFSTAEICLSELAEAWSLHLGRLHTGAWRMETLLCLETTGGDTVGAL